MWRTLAISLLVRPFFTNRQTSISRGVSFSLPLIRVRPKVDVRSIKVLSKLLNILGVTTGYLYFLQGRQESVFNILHDLVFQALFFDIDLGDELFEGNILFLKCLLLLS